METYKYMAMIKPEKLGNLSLFSKKEYIPTAYFASRNPLNKDANQKKGSVASGTSLLQGKVSYIQTVEPTQLHRGRVHLPRTTWTDRRHKYFHSKTAFLIFRLVYKLL